MFRNKNKKKKENNMVTSINIKMMGPKGNDERMGKSTSSNLIGFGNMKLDLLFL